MITRRFAVLYGWVTLTLLLVLLVLVWSGMIAPEQRLPVLIIAGLLVVSRLTLTLIANRREREKPRNDPPAGS